MKNEAKRCRTGRLSRLMAILLVCLLLPPGGASAGASDPSDPVQLGAMINGVISFHTSTTVQGVGVLDANFRTAMYMKTVITVGDLLVWEMTVFSGTTPPYTVIYKDKSNTWHSSTLDVSAYITPSSGTVGNAGTPVQPEQPAGQLTPSATGSTGTGPYGFWPHFGDESAYGVRATIQGNHSGMSATLTQSDGARTGPSTVHSEWGTFLPGGHPVQVISHAFDVHGSPWAQLEYTHRGRLSRSYTLYMRLAGAPPLSAIPKEYPLNKTVSMQQDTVPSTGPGANYAQYTSMELKSGRQGTAIAAEGDWLMVDFPGVGDKHIFRVWVPAQVVSLY